MGKQSGMSHSSNGEKFTFPWAVLRELDQWFYLVNKYRTFTSYMFFSLVGFLKNNVCWTVPKMAMYPSSSMFGFICFITLYAHNFPRPSESHLQAVCPFSPKYLSELKNRTFSSITITQLSNSGNLTLLQYSLIYSPYSNFTNYPKIFFVICFPY